MAINAGDIDLKNPEIRFPAYIKFKDGSIGCFRDNGEVITVHPDIGLSLNDRNIKGDSKKREYYFYILTYLEREEMISNLDDFDALVVETADLLMKKIGEIANDEKNVS